MDTETPVILSETEQQLRETTASLQLSKTALALARVKRRLKRLEESSVLHDWVNPYGDLLDRLRADEGLLLAPSTFNDRLYGGNWPFWRTWTEHAILRAQSRWLATISDLAGGAISGLASYVIGDGYTYRASVK